MTQAYELEPVGSAGRYNLQQDRRVVSLADLQNPPYDKGRTSTERLGRMGREIS